MVEPKLRFSEFKNSWNNYKIEDMFDRVGIPVDLDDTQTYREIGIRSHGKGIFHKEETTATEIGNKRVFWVEPDCFVVNIVFAWERAVAKTTEKENGMIASHRFPMYKPKKNIVDLDYITEYFITKRGQNVLILASPGGAGRNKTLGQKEFAKSVVKLPSLPEQQKIAEFLSTIDTVIEKQKETVSAWEERKKGVMQKLFSQEVRFKADDGSDFPDTELVSIGEHITFSGGSQPDKKYFIYEEREGYIRLVQTQDYRTDKYKTYIPIEKARKTCTETDVMIGRYGPPVFQIKRGIAGAYNVALIKATEKDSSILDKEFMFYLLNRNDLFLALDAVSRRSAGQAGVDMELLKSFKFYLPSIPEQQKIADCLSSLDEVIEKQKATLAAWEELKKGLLQQMFV
ncbi:restriction endonuclease subunit S [Anaerostipes hadrus]|uniref:restriction endonuclease subunit S n=1 Tax=Anaerostipes hadrus TaxID=649756 RepID=UPI0032C11EFE